MGKYRLLTASLDGGDETVLHIEPTTLQTTSVAWSSDGKKIVFSSFGLGKVIGSLRVFDVDTKKQATIAEFNDKGLAETRWLPGAQWLLVNYYPEAQMFTSGFTDQGQLGLVSFASGEFRPVTRDTNNYSSLTVSANGKTAATVQVRTARDLDLLKSHGMQASSLPVLLAQAQDVHSFNWTKDGNLLITDSSRLQRIGSDGTGATTLLSDPDAAIGNPSQCGDRYLVFSWAFHGDSTNVTVWRANTDGSGAKQLTNGTLDYAPVCSVDGTEVYYATEARVVMRVPIGGGQPDMVPGTSIPNTDSIESPTISPDGSLLAFRIEVNDAANPQRSYSKLATLNRKAGRKLSVDLLDPDPRIRPGLTFTPDGKGLAYPIQEKGVDNIWVQPLERSSGRQITHFRSGQIGDFRWSPDGSILAVEHEEETADVVLLQESKH